MKEVDVARPVVEWLRKNGHEVYQEVTLSFHAGVADIVAVKDGRLWIVEAKVSLSWDLLAQAYGRKDWAHRVSVAVPQRRWKSKTRRYVQSFMKREGLGLITVGKWREMVAEPVEAPEQERKPLWATKLQKSLHVAQKDFVEAGTAGGGHWTPFKQTCMNALDVVQSNPGLTAKELVAAIDHHYHSDASARSGLIARTRQGLVPGIEVRKVKNRVRFYPVVKT